MPINSIVHFSGIPIEKNKRNGRDQKTHLEIARSTQAILNKVNGTNWRDNNGRKSALYEVFAFLDKNPGATYHEFCQKTGLKKSVFYKYKPLWNEKKKTDYEAYRKRFAFASIFDNCVKDAQTGEPVALLQVITGIPTPKEPLSYEEWLKTISTQHNEQK
jgi:hypothetical protein